MKKNCFHIFSMIIYIGLFLLHLNSVQAATYYVTQQGLDTNNGSQGTPFLTIQKALDTVAAGDQIEIADGTYTEELIAKTSGTAGNTITINCSSQVNLQLKASAANILKLENMSFYTINKLRINKIDANNGNGILISGKGESILIDGSSFFCYASDKTGTTAVIIDGTDDVNTLKNIEIKNIEIGHCKPQLTKGTITLKGNLNSITFSQSKITNQDGHAIYIKKGDAITKAPSGVIIQNQQIDTIKSEQAGKYASAIYVDNGDTIQIKNSNIALSDIGIKLSGTSAVGTLKPSGITIESISFSGNTIASIEIGGVDNTEGKADAVQIKNCNFQTSSATLKGELLIQNCKSTTVQNCIFTSPIPIYNSNQNTPELLSLSNNEYKTCLFTTPLTLKWVWAGITYNDFKSYQDNSQQDSTSKSECPAVNTGTNGGKDDKPVQPQPKPIEYITVFEMNADEDTTVKGGKNQETNYGKEKSLSARMNPSDELREDILIKFVLEKRKKALQEIAGLEIDIRLKLYCTSVVKQDKENGSIELGLYETVNKDWLEDQVNYKTSPEISVDRVALQHVTTDKKWYEFQGIHEIQKLKKPLYKVYSISYKLLDISATSEKGGNRQTTQQVIFDSKDSGTEFQPVLEIIAQKDKLQEFCKDNSELKVCKKLDKNGLLDDDQGDLGGVLYQLYISTFFMIIILLL